MEIRIIKVLLYIIAVVQWYAASHWRIITFVTGFVKIDPNHTGTEIHFIAEH